MSQVPSSFQMAININTHMLKTEAKILQKVLNGVEVRMKNTADLRVGTENRVSQLFDQYLNGLRVL